MVRLKGAIVYVNSPEATAKQMRAAVRDANAFVVGYWHRKIMPGHFTVAGGKKYGYQKRQGDDQPPLVQSRSKKKKYAGRMVKNPAYSWRKRREKGHNKPLVWSGDAERMAKRMIRISSTSKKGVGVMTLPKYVYAYRKDLKQPDKAAELVTVARDEVTRMARLHELFVTRRLEQMRDRSTVKVA